MPQNRQKFIELAEKRVNRAMRDLRLIGNLSNTANYEYTDKDVKKIFNALKNVLKEAQDKFSNKPVNGAGSFRLEQ